MTKKFFTKALCALVVCFQLVVAVPVSATETYAYCDRPCYEEPVPLDAGGRYPWFA